MNIEFITDADYVLPKVPLDTKTQQTFNPAVGPTFKCGSMTRVKNCAHKGCACQPINARKYNPR
jgi:hypothetical protein